MTLRPTLKHLGRKPLQLVRNYAFTKGLLMVFAIVSIVAAASYLGDLAVGVSSAVGVFLVSICDLPGNRLEHLKNMLLGLLLAVFNLVVIQLSLADFYLNLAVLPVLVFLTAYLSVLGKRASLVSFSGLLALVLAYAFPKTGWEIAYSGFYVAVGGLWFIVLNFVVHAYRYRRYRLGLLNDAMTHIADYLRLKAEQLRAEDPDTLWPDLIGKHNEISEIRKILTDYFLSQSPGRDTLKGQTREGVLYIELIDLVELGAAVPVRPEFRTPALSSITDDLADIQAHTADALRRVAGKSRSFRTETPDHLQARLDEIARHLRSGAQGLSPDERYSAYTLHDNLEKQLSKVRSVEQLGDIREPVDHVLFSREAKSRLRIEGSFDLAPLRENLSAESATFRHCIRLAVVILAGFLLGHFLGVHNAYWIILTVVVIMRPSYVQSKERSVQRTIGTLAGAVVAAAIVTLTDNTVIYAVIGATAMPFVFIYLDRDYRLSAFFVTLNLVFTYALLHPDAYAVIGYRVIDTLIGASLAFLASRLLWPAWDSRSIHKLIASAIGSSRDYLREESELYRNRKDESFTYRIARREAFSALGELDASYARVLKEPGGTDEVVRGLSGIVTQHHRILSGIAYLGTYVQYHAVSVSQRHFSALIDDLCARLQECRDLLGTAPGAASAGGDTDSALAYFRQTPAECMGVEELEQRHLFLTEYAYLRRLIEALRVDLLAYLPASASLLSGGPR